MWTRFNNENSPSYARGEMHGLGSGKLAHSTTSASQCSEKPVELWRGCISDSIMKVMD